MKDFRMRKGLIYIHGKGGSAIEAEHYKTLFAEYDVIGLDYHAQVPWKAKIELTHFLDEISARYEQITIVANSIGAFFAMHALGNSRIVKAYFISPIVNMEKLIIDMMQWVNVSENELRQKGNIQTEFGESLSWEYLEWVRNHPITWKIPTYILYGENDKLQSLKDIQRFAAEAGADVTVMANGEHWFHTQEQMHFLDTWIKRKETV